MSAWLRERHLVGWNFPPGTTGYHTEEERDDSGNRKPTRSTRALQDGAASGVDSDEFMPLSAGDALLIVDVQNDFLPGGRLPVAQGDAVIAPLNRYIAEFVVCGLPIIATRDRHPPNHCSFVAQGGRWPPHCVCDTGGMEFAEGLVLPADVLVIDKATEPDREALSAFAEAGFERELRRLRVQRLFVGGLATDYCVRETVLDALRHGFQVTVLLDAVRAVDIEPGDGDRAIQEMGWAGARILCTREVQR